MQKLWGFYPIFLWRLTLNDAQIDIWRWIVNYPLEKIARQGGEEIQPVGLAYQRLLKTRCYRAQVISRYFHFKGISCVATFPWSFVSCCIFFIIFYFSLFFFTFILLLRYVMAGNVRGFRCGPNANNKFIVNSFDFPGFMNWFQFPHNGQTQSSSLLIHLNAVRDDRLEKKKPSTLLRLNQFYSILTGVSSLCTNYFPRMNRNSSEFIRSRLTSLNNWAVNSVMVFRKMKNDTDNNEILFQPFQFIGIARLQLMEKTQPPGKQRRKKPEAITLRNLFVQRHCICLMRLFSFFISFFFSFKCCLGTWHNRISNYFELHFKIICCATVQMTSFSPTGNSNDVINTFSPLNHNWISRSFQSIQINQHFTWNDGWVEMQCTSWMHNWIEITLTDQPFRNA